MHSTPDDIPEVTVNFFNIPIDFPAIPVELLVIPVALHFNWFP